MSRAIQGKAYGNPAGASRLPVCVVAAAVLLPLLLAACAGRPAVPPAAPDPAPAGRSLRLPTPPLRSERAQALRHVSAGSTVFDNADVFANDAGGQTGPAPDGAFIIIPGSEDELAWAIFRIGLAAGERPVELDLGTAIIIPGSEDELVSYWLGVYSFSQARWEWSAPDGETPGRYEGPGEVSVVLNSASQRTRCFNLSDECYVAVVVDAPSTLGETHSVKVTGGGVDFRSTDDPAYFRPAPLPATLAGVDLDLATGQTELSFAPDAGTGADEVRIQRRLQESGADWELLRTYPVTPALHSDPQDNPGLEPVLGQPYEYRAIAVTIDNGEEFHASPGGAFGDGWRVSTVDSTPQTGAFCSLAEVNGSAGIAYLDTSAGSGILRFALLDPLGSNWSTKDVDTTNGAGYYCTLKVVNGNPAIAYYQLENAPDPAALMYARSDGSLGVGENGWSTVAVDTSGTVNQNNIALAVIDGQPSIACTIQFGGLAYFRAGDSDGTTWGGMSIADAAANSSCSMIELNSLPAISYRRGSDFCFIRANVASGDNWSPAVVVDPGVAVLGDTSLALVNGHPAISYYDFNTPALKYARCSQSDGGSLTTDWVPLQVDTDGGFNSALVQAANGPAIAYTRTGPPRAQFCAVASDPNGSDWSSLQTVQAMGSGTGSACSLAVIGGRLAMCYKHSADHMLRYAVYY